MPDKRIRISTGAAFAVCALLNTGRSTSSDDHHEPMASSVTIENQWASSAETGMAGMAGVFGTFSNKGDDEARIVSAEAPIAGRVEVHEVVPDASGAMTMRPKEGGFEVPAGGSRELIPGGDHLMLMDLKQPLQPGADVSLTVVFEDGSTLPVTAQIRDFAGANEEYTPGGPGSGGGHH
ncbi:copper chaperone PCu(A)C [Mycobacterium neglectum]|uniref:copper chaperone PCu(A)C n=1 Tax=Mycobacterium neglectum TaxID=242737 RepID=UPI000BFEE304|nr:copper chaperone PCu(A)C [Mycobacterium neglectum]